MGFLSASALDCSMLLGTSRVLLEEAGELYSSIIHVHIRLKSDSFNFLDHIADGLPNDVNVLPRTRAQDAHFPKDPATARPLDSSERQILGSSRKHRFPGWQRSP
jgi:hypothetical protein